MRRAVARHSVEARLVGAASPEEIDSAIARQAKEGAQALVVLSGGSRIDDDHLLAQTRYIMEAGGSGVIYGRNVWQREWSEALGVIEQIKEIMLSSVRRIP